MARIDLNCDLGEGGSDDEALLSHVTSANIACGAHAGDRAIMRSTVLAAKRWGAAIGAHPGYRDRAQFGRREIPLSPEQVVELVAEQIALLVEIAAGEGVRLSHVKPHGALYNLAARDPVTASAVAEAVRSVDPSLILVGLAGSESLKQAASRGLRVGAEAFADRAYLSDGSLAPRTRRDAVLTDPRAVEQQVLEIVRSHRVASVDGVEVPLEADTLCLHSDTPDAVRLAQHVRRSLVQAGVDVKPLAAD
jgi:UPF0271 protein